MKRNLLLVCSVLVIIIQFSSAAHAQGISVDAGLTPPEDRWMVRNVVHFMQRDHDPTTMNRNMKMYMFNTVVAYGLRRDLTLMLKQPVVYREMSMAGMSSDNTDLGDLSLMMKYGIFRRNTKDYTFGLATTVGVKFPTGAEEFSNGTKDLKPGIYMSFRGDRWGTDLAVAYDWKGFSGENDSGLDPGDELSLDWAVAYRNSIGTSGDIILVPVLELSYRHIDPHNLSGHDMLNSGESFMFLSPGVKLTQTSLVIEALLQIPVYQEQEGMQLERGIGLMVGTRYMF